MVLAVILTVCVLIATVAMVSSRFLDPTPGDILGAISILVIVGCFPVLIYVLLHQPQPKVEDEDEPEPEPKTEKPPKKERPKKEEALGKKGKDEKAAPKKKKGEKPAPKKEKEDKVPPKKGKDKKASPKKEKPPKDGVECMRCGHVNSPKPGEKKPRCAECNMILVQKESKQAKDKVRREEDVPEKKEGEEEIDPTSIYGGIRL